MADKIKTYSIKDRYSKVNIDSFSKAGNSLFSLIPRIEQGGDFLCLVRKIKEIKGSKGIVVGFGAHLIKCGLSPILIEMMKNGYITALATNGASLIHDFEVSYSGNTSEDVKEALRNGEFGMADETSVMLNALFDKAVRKKKPFNIVYGAFIKDNAFKYREFSVFYWAYKLNIPITIHVAIGTDIIHMHPESDGRNIGQVSMDSFRLFIENIKKIGGGGMYLNIGSAVLLPEIFLKAIGYIRNIDSSFGGFTSVVFDFIKHYRPMQNVVQRPKVLDSEGYYFVGSHEILLPLLYYLLEKQ